MIDRLAPRPPGEDALFDPFPVPSPDPRGIRPLRLVQRLYRTRARPGAVMPRRSRDPGHGQRGSLRPQAVGQFCDEGFLPVEELLASVVAVSSGSCSFNSCKSPIAFPNASLAPSNSRIRSAWRASSASLAASAF